MHRNTRSSAIHRSTAEQTLILGRSFSNRWGVWLVFTITTNANSLDPEQMLSSTASVLGLHCLQMSLLWDARHKGISVNIILRLAFQISKYLMDRVKQKCVFEQVQIAQIQII